MIYDFLIIGAGSAGCNSAYALNKANKRVAIVDKEGIAKGASGAAGAFLSPLPGKKNPYNSFVNTALNFSINFYEKLSPELILEKGVLRVPNDNFNAKKLKDNALSYKYLNSDELNKISNQFKNIEGYFYTNAAIVDPLEVCQSLIKGCDFYQKDIKVLKQEDGYYDCEGLKARNIILAQGVNTPLVEYPYVEISPIFGVRIDVKTSTQIPFNIHKSISVSTNKKDNIVAIGATQQNHSLAPAQCDTICEKCPFYLNRDEEDVKSLLKQSQELIELNELEVLKVYKGARATIKSYFPVIGKVINYEKTVEKYPSIKNGTTIPNTLLEYYPNIYTINALGSRGFVYGPYLADILKENILNGVEIPKEISLEKLFYKMARNKKV